MEVLHHWKHQCCDFTHLGIWRLRFASTCRMPDVLLRFLSVSSRDSAARAVHAFVQGAAGEAFGQHEENLRLLMHVLSDIGPVIVIVGTSSLVLVCLTADHAVQTVNTTSRQYLVIAYSRANSKADRTIPC